jgi:hypothetical protein
VSIVSIVGLMQIDLPGHTVRLCDGGFVPFMGQTFTSHDSLLGAIDTIEGLGEGIGDEVPALQVTFLPAGDAAPEDLARADFQTARCRFWVADYDPATGLVVGTPDVEFDGQIDTVVLAISGSGERTLDTSIVSLMEKLFERNLGNSLNSAWHKSIWPGELGHDNATGLTIPVAWGVESPARATASIGAGGGTRAREAPYSRMSDR